MATICTSDTNRRVAHFLLALVLAALSAFSASIAAAAVEPQVMHRIASASVPFVPNAGQWNEQVSFAAQTFAGTVFLTTDGKLVFSLPGKLPENAKVAGGGVENAAKPVRGHHPSDQQPVVQSGPGWVLTETLVGANRRPVVALPAGYLPGAAQVSYFIGNDAGRHQRALPALERVSLGEVFPGITVQLRATGSNVEKIFTVAPRQDTDLVRVQLGGATHIELGRNGELIAHTGNGPVAYTGGIVAGG